MSHQPRWIPESSTPDLRSLVEVSTRTFQSRYLLCPTPKVRELVLGVIGRAQRMYEMEICLLTFMSNHYHMLVMPEDALHLARFMNFVNAEIAREINRLGYWGAKVWARRFDSIPISDEPAAQLARFRYLLSHGVKEDLVERPSQWIGAHCVDAWLRGEPLRGRWYDRDRETRARRRGRSVGKHDFATEETVVLTPLPCWQAQGLGPDAIRSEIQAMVDDLVQLARWGRKLAGRPLVGTAAVLSLAPDHRPATTKRSPRPRFHARSKAARDRFRDALRDFLAAYRAASAAFRSGDAKAHFPDRCFPPAPRFVGRGIIEVGGG